MSCEEGTSAMEKVKNASQPFNIAFIDNQMPLMSGLELISKIREFEADKSQKMIIVCK